MHWRDHSNFRGQHASILSPSKHHWLGYTDDKFDRLVMAVSEAKRGTEEHIFAAEAIRLKHKLEDNGTTLSMYVNDAIGFRMKPELVLVYSPHAFGTTDAIGFRKNKLRVHDLKTGSALTSMRQLRCYDALFCLEYGFNPFKIEIENRIYQNDDIKIDIPDPDDIVHIMQNYKARSRRIDELREEMEE